jgi:hypothetical protein
LSSTGVIAGAGTVSAPAITTTGDTNTGIFFPAADTIGLAVGGVEAARLVSGLFSVPANSTAPSAIRLFEDTDNGTNYVDVIAPAAITSNRTLTIPDETGTIITTASSGQSIPKAALPTGSVLQVVQTTKTDTFSTSSTSKTDITGMSVSITPTSATSKILIIANINYGGTDYNYYCDLLRGATVLNAPASGVNPCTISLSGITTTTYQILEGTISFLDSPATTSSTTYKLQIACQTSGTFYLNRSNRNGASDSVCSSTITAMEIAA